MINHFFYNEQLRQYLLQFCNIFVGLKVQTGKGECGEKEFITVPVTIGSRDRVVAAIQAGNTQNRPFAVPIIAVNMSNLSLAPVRKGVGIVDRRTILPTGGIFPDDLKTVTRVMPIQYTMSIEMLAYASNTDQMYQMLEQILVLFDPCLQIQTSDAPLDWTKITSVELVGLANEENNPPGSDRRIINWSFNFDLPIYLSIPVNIKEDIVKSITVTLAEGNTFKINEFDENGDLAPFDTSKILGSFTVSG